MGEGGPLAVDEVPATPNAQPHNQPRPFPVILRSDSEEESQKNKINRVGKAESHDFRFFLYNA